MHMVKRESPKYRSGKANRDWAGEATRAVACCLAVAVSLLGGPSEAQQAWSIEDVTTESLSVLAAAGSAAVPETVGEPDRLNAESATIQVDLDLIRSAPARLELPTTDGRVLTAELSVFEDRGGGDVLWSGRLLGVDHDSIALTIADHRFAGWFGEPMGVKYRLGAGAGGGGLMLDAHPATQGFRCGLADQRPFHGPVEPDEHVDERRAARRSDWGTRDSSNNQNHDGFKMLVLYTESAARVWDNPQYGWGGTTAALRNAADYLTMVFRNGRLPLEPAFEFAKAPPWLDAVQRDPLIDENGIVGVFNTSGEIEVLRRDAGADHVHLFYNDDVLPLPFAGLATQNGGASRLGGPGIFAHEVGHDLGGDHQPEVAAPSRAERLESVENGAPEWYGYSFAHAWREDGTGVEDGEWGRFGSATAYPSTEPYYSTVRLQPHGQQIGIAGERENERVFRTTVHDVAAKSVIEERVPAPPSNLRVEVASGSVRLAWKDNSASEIGFHVSVIPHKDWDAQIEDRYNHHVGANVESLSLPIPEPGIYTVNVRAVGKEGTPRHSGEFSFAYREFETLVVPGAEPQAPTRVQVAVDPGGWAGPDRCRIVTWNEQFTAADKDLFGGGLSSEVQVLRNGRLFKRFFRAAGVESVSYCLPEGEGLYEFRVYARSWGGRSGSRESVTVAVGIEDPIAVPAGDRAAALHWGGNWSSPRKGDLRVEGRTPELDDWAEFARAKAGDGSVRIDGLTPETPYTFRLVAGREGAEEYSDLLSLTTGRPVESCRDGAPYLCLQNERFEVRAHWSNPDRSGDFGKGTAVPAGASDESGLFWFFDPDNVELVLKVLDGRAVNGNHWVFFGALSDVEYWVTVDDTTSGRRLTYYNPPKTICGQSDTQSFGSASLASGASYSSSSGVDVPGTGLMRLTAAPLDRVGASAEAANSGDCAPGDERLCLLGERFAVEVEFVDPKDGFGKAGQVLPALSTGSTGFFWFFSPGNVELAAKVLDGRALNGKFWFLYGGLSDVEFVITVTDTETGEVRSYRNPPGSVCGGIDTQALGQ